MERGEVEREHVRVWEGEKGRHRVGVDRECVRA
jgi:hypothetical protein